MKNLTGFLAAGVLVSFLSSSEVWAQSSLVPASQYQFTPGAQLIEVDPGALARRDRGRLSGGLSDSDRERMAEEPYTAVRISAQVTNTGAERPIFCTARILVRVGDQSYSADLAIHSASGLLGGLRSGDSGAGVENVRVNGSGGEAVIESAQVTCHSDDAEETGEMASCPDLSRIPASRLGLYRRPYSALFGAGNPSCAAAADRAYYSRAPLDDLIGGALEAYDHRDSAESSSGVAK